MMDLLLMHALGSCLGSQTKLAVLLLYKTSWCCESGVTGKDGNATLDG
jgi:hypothetical protein